MLQNPFSPIFGGKPNVFFGRSEILSRFDLAMIDQGSDDRAFFFTGTRGSGKTALLEQLSIRATNTGRVVIDLGPEDTITQLVHELAGFDEKTLAACAKARNGLLVTVDEVQKIPLEDISALCNAFQMASRKGQDIMLAVAGLPYAYADITRHEGCTYLRRASHEEIGLFTWEETDEAYKKVFSTIKGLKTGQELIDKLNSASYGHPYLMQLMGYHLILRLNQNSEKLTNEILNDEADAAISNALLAYERRALEPLMDELPDSERKYLSAMSECLNDDRLASTSDIAAYMNADQSRISKNRAHLIDNGIIAAPERGFVMFCIPYLADYARKGRTTTTAIEIARKRRV